ncbi:hypothetical protein FFF34_009995 [Inquilinus sp. KBS0705]|nr:hypothetical protein FFF34_009995 [Inquilinus sp. KBS0705]
MKKIILVLILGSFYFKANAQTVVGPVEKKITDNLCDCINKLDLSKITNSEEANKAFMDCFMAQADLAVDLAAERGVELSDNVAMNKMGTDIGRNLLKQKCEGFLKLAVKMANKKDQIAVQATTGTFKRVDVKGFNYIVITDNAGSEKSFLWLRQFPGSEQFTGSTIKFAGKKLKISWQDIEVYLPTAKGYYQVKEITAIDLL